MAVQVAAGRLRLVTSTAGTVLGQQMLFKVGLLLTGDLK